MFLFLDYFGPIAWFSSRFYVPTKRNGRHSDRLAIGFVCDLKEHRKKAGKRGLRLRNRIGSVHSIPLANAIGAKSCSRCEWSILTSYVMAPDSQHAVWSNFILLDTNPLGELHWTSSALVFNTSISKLFVFAWLRSKDLKMSVSVTRQSSHMDVIAFLKEKKLDGVVEEFQGRPFLSIYCSFFS